MVHVCVPETVLQGMNDDIVEHHVRRTHRPTVVAVIESGDTGKVLVVQSAKNFAWGFPQGGVERAEDAVSAVLREVREEVGIAQSDIEMVVKHCFSDNLTSPRKYHDFTVGKRYHYFHLRCRGTPQVVMEPTEIRDFRWYEHSQAEAFIRSTVQRVEKQKHLLRALYAIREPRFP